MIGQRNTLVDFVSVAFRKQTYMNILYLLFTFPLGTAYFVFLVSGLSLGFSLMTIWVGIPILILIFLAWWEIASFERQLAIWLLGVYIPPMSRGPGDNAGLVNKGVTRLKNPVTWKSLLYLFLKFPMGIMSLVVTVVLISLTLSMLLSPVIYRFHSISFGMLQVNSLEESLLAAALGIIVGLVSLHLMNLLAKIAGSLAVLMLGSPQIENIEILEKET
ncbi:sensor domain-containing protein [Methanolobus sp. ZRKC2]|uniref:sensor domain-containing protein n=1 Tax=Methanolobus sp. ZRKC2 TaxID=3125783 RepID=UPI0032505913